MSASHDRFPGRMWIVSAPSGGGKTSLTRAVVERLRAHGIDSAISVSYTTRPARPGEQEGVHYHFVDESGFLQMAGQGKLLEHAHVFGRRYGTGRAETEAALARGTEVFLDIDWQGARQLRECELPGHSVFLLPPSIAALEERLRARGQDNDDTIARRMQAAREELSHYAEYDFLIVNSQFEQALTELEALVRSQRLDRARQLHRHAELLDRLGLCVPPEC